MIPRGPLIAISLDRTTCTPDERSHGSAASGPPPIPPPNPPPGQGPGGGGGGIGPCQSKCTRPNRWPGWLGSRSGMICLPSPETVPVPYLTITPFVGSSVSNSILTPGEVLSVFGNVTATGWLATELAGWNATMNAPTVELFIGISSGNLSTGTWMPMNGNGLGRVPSTRVNTVPA